jgi:hypothetical protein
VAGLDILTSAEGLRRGVEPRSLYWKYHSRDSVEVKNAGSGGADPCYVSEDDGSDGID